MSDIAEYSTADLIAELSRRGVSVRGCVCGPARREIVQHVDDKYLLPRKGCLNCDLWDGPPVLRT